MRFTQRIVTLLKSLNPDSYAKLCSEMKLGDVIKQFLFTYIILFALMLILLVSAAFVGAPALQQKLASFDSFTLGGNFSASAPVTLLTHPKVTINLQENATLDGSTVAFTKQGISWKRWLLFGSASRPWSSLTDVKTAGNGVYLALLVFLVPSIAFWAGLGFFALSAILVLLFGLLAWLVPRLWRVRLSVANAYKIAIFASTVMMAVQLLLFPFWRSWWLGPLLYALFLAIGVALVGEREYALHERKKARRKDSALRGRKL